MAQTQTLVDTLKKALKVHGLTYRQVAREMNLSEASIKRVFAERSFSLNRLDEICALMGLEISDLIKMMETDRRTLSQLTEKQERELVADVKLMLVAFLVVNGWSAKEIRRFRHISEPELIRYLAKLDKLKVVELLPNNRIKLLVASNFAWRKNGPIQKFFTDHLQQEFFKSQFDKKGEFFMFLSGMLSYPSTEGLIKKMKELAGEYNELAQHDKHLPLDQRSGSSMIVAIRPWWPSVFNELNKR